MTRKTAYNMLLPQTALVPVPTPVVGLNTSSRKQDHERRPAARAGPLAVSVKDDNKEK